MVKPNKKTHYSFDEKVKILLETVPHIDGTTAREIANAIDYYTFYTLGNLAKAISKIAQGK
jgi:hypothetical protein